MEEYIKILEELASEKYSERLLNTLSMAKEEDEVYILTIYERQAIENLIKGYKEKEESEKYLYDAYQDAGKKMFEYAEQLEDSVPKSKIKEKIEELEKQIDDLMQNGDVYDDNVAKYNDLKLKIQVLQELMEDK